MSMPELLPSVTITVSPGGTGSFARTAMPGQLMSPPAKRRSSSCGEAGYG
jgi:hypothetical protein